MTSEDVRDPDEYRICRPDFEAQQTAAGWVVIHPRANELQLDFDDVAEMPAETIRKLDILQKLVSEPITIVTTKSKSGAGIHVHIFLPFDVLPAQRIALQAALGSDGVRELLSMFRLFKGDETASLLIETKEGADLVNGMRGALAATLTVA